MDIKRIIISGLAMVVALSVFSCKKDDEDTTYTYLNGNPDFAIPAYAQAGDILSMTPETVKDDEGNEASYYWSVSPVIAEKDTVKNFTLTLSDTLCTVTVTCYAFAEGYYSTSSSHTVTIVSSDRTKGSIRGASFDSSKDFVFTDPRDGRDYWCTTIGETDWFKENLAYRGTGAPMENCMVTADVFGMFYSWEDARTSCPEGWRLSSLEDWSDAAAAASAPDAPKDAHIRSVAGDFMGDIYFNGTKMWEYWPQVKISGKLGLEIMPAGFANISAATPSFSSLYDYAAFWTADERDDDMAYYRYIYAEQDDLMLGSAGKRSFGASVRCVRDHEQ